MERYGPLTRGLNGYNANRRFEIQESIDRIPQTIARIEAIRDKVENLASYRSVLQDRASDFWTLVRRHVTATGTFASFVRHVRSADDAMHVVGQLRRIASMADIIDEDVQRQVVGYSNDARSICDWVDEGQRFMREDSLWWIIDVARADHTFLAKGSDVYTREGTRWLRCGLDGLATASDREIEDIRERRRKAKKAAGA